MRSVNVLGVNSVNRITRLASDLGIKYLTLYAFSTENWLRPAGEVEALMHLIIMAYGAPLAEFVTYRDRERGVPVGILHELAFYAVGVGELLSVDGADASHRMDHQEGDSRT